MTTYTSSQSSRLTLTGAGAIALAFIVAVLGAGIDVLTGPGLRRSFAVALVIGAVLAAFLVRRRDLWIVAVSPPIIYLVVAMLSGVTGTAYSSKTALEAQFANWLVYGFPEMAAATGLAVLIALVRAALKK